MKRKGGGVEFSKTKKAPTLPPMAVLTAAGRSFYVARK